MVDFLLGGYILFMVSLRHITPTRKEYEQHIRDLEGQNQWKWVDTVHVPKYLEGIDGFVWVLKKSEH